MAKLEDKRGGPINQPGCMNATLSYRAVGDRSFVGIPAVMTPTKGAVWIQVSCWRSVCQGDCSGLL